MLMAMRILQYEVNVLLWWWITDHYMFCRSDLRTGLDLDTLDKKMRNNLQRHLVIKVTTYKPHRDLFQIKLELFRLRSEDTPATPWLLIWLTSSQALKSSYWTPSQNKANLRDLIAATGLVILLKLDSNRRFFSLETPNLGQNRRFF